MVVVVTLASSNARADSERRVSIRTNACAARMSDEIGRIAAIELHAARVGSADASPDVTRIDVTCESADVIALHVSDPLTSKDVSRKVSIAGIDERARARTIALAVAELVSASWVELETTPEPVVEPVPQRVLVVREPPPIEHKVARSRPRARSSPPVVVFEAVAGARVFFQSRELLLGGGAAIEPWLTRTTLLRFDGFVEHASTTRRPGDVNIDTASTSAAIGFGKSSGDVRLTGTIGLRAGYARLVGLAKAQNLQGQVIDGAWLGPEVRLGVEIAPRAHVHLVIDWSVGWAFAGVVGPIPGDRDVLAEGPWGAVSIGFAAN